MPKIVVRSIGAAKNLKALVDGACAAFQRDDGDRLTEPITRLSALQNEVLIRCSSSPRTESAIGHTLMLRAEGGRCSLNEGPLFLYAGCRRADARDVERRLLRCGRCREP